MYCLFLAGKGGTSLKILVKNPHENIMDKKSHHALVIFEIN